jgi:hypothetical protein
MERTVPGGATEFFDYRRRLKARVELLPWEVLVFYANKLHRAAPPRRRGIVGKLIVDWEPVVSD